MSLGNIDKVSYASAASKGCPTVGLIGECWNQQGQIW